MTTPPPEAYEAAAVAHERHLATVTDILDDIDDTLTYYSAGLGSEVTVPVERPDMDPLTWVVDADDVRDMERELCECELCRARAEACSICRAEAEAGASPGTGDGHPAISALELAARIAEGGQTP